MRNREFYERELAALEGIDTSVGVNGEKGAYTKLSERIAKLEEKHAKRGTVGEDGEVAKDLNNAERHELKELKILRARTERKEELEVLLNMNGIEEFTEEAKAPSAQEEALEMIDGMINSNAERAAEEATRATTDTTRTFRGKIPQKLGYYMTTVPEQLTKRGEVRSRKDEMSKNSVIGASMQLVTLEALLQRPDLSDKQKEMIDKLMTYYNKVLDMHMQQDLEYEESQRAEEQVETGDESRQDESEEIPIPEETRAAIEKQELNIIIIESEILTLERKLEEFQKDLENAQKEGKTEIVEACTQQISIISRLLEEKNKDYENRINAISDLAGPDNTLTVKVNDNARAYYKASGKVFAAQDMFLATPIQNFEADGKPEAAEYLMGKYTENDAERKEALEEERNLEGTFEEPIEAMILAKKTRTTELESTDDKKRTDRQQDEEEIGAQEPTEEEIEEASRDTSGHSQMDLDDDEPEVVEESEEQVDYDNLTAEQKRQFQLQGARANLAKLVEELKELEAQKAAAKEEMDIAEKAGDKTSFEVAQLKYSGINMKMQPLQNKVAELNKQIESLEREGQDAPEQTAQTQDETSIDETSVGGAAAPKQPANKDLDKEEPEASDDKNKEQDEQVVGEARGFKALIAMLIKVLRVITRNEHLLDGTMARLSDVKSLPSSSQIKMTNVPENSGRVDESKVADEVAAQLTNEEVEQAVDEAQVVAEESEKAVQTAEEEKEEPEQKEETIDDRLKLKGEDAEKFEKGQEKVLAELGSKSENQELTEEKDGDQIR